MRVVLFLVSALAGRMIFEPWSVTTNNSHLRVVFLFSALAGRKMFKSQLCSFVTFLLSLRHVAWRGILGVILNRIGEQIRSQENIINKYINLLDQE